MTRRPCPFAQALYLSKIDFGQYLQNLVVDLVHSFQVDSGRVRRKVDIGKAARDIHRPFVLLYPARGRVLY